MFTIAPPDSSTTARRSLRYFASTEMLAPRFDLVDIEFRFDMRQEVFQVHFGRRRIVISLVSTRIGIAEGIGSDGNSLVWRGRKLQVGSGASGFGDLQTGP